jgi:CRISPR/Cas system CMR subunit Cmr4 (Cas7 group RAMP superfamily)
MSEGRSPFKGYVDSVGSTSTASVSVCRAGRLVKCRADQTTRPVTEAVLWYYESTPTPNGTILYSRRRRVKQQQSDTVVYNTV